MKFGLFYAGELLHALTVGAIFATLFLGGWRGPYAEQFPLLGVFYLFAKAFIIYYMIMWIKYTLPRIRIDHLLNFSWKFLTPVAIAILLITAIAEKLLEGSVPAARIGIMLVVNIILGFIIFFILRSYAQIKRKRVGEDRPIAQPPTEIQISGVE